MFAILDISKVLLEPVSWIIDALPTKLLMETDNVSALQVSIGILNEVVLDAKEEPSGLELLVLFPAESKRSTTKL